MFDQLKEDTENLKYLPDLKEPPVKAPDRELCFIIVNSVCNSFIEKAVEEALKLRNKDKSFYEKHQEL